MLKKVISTFFFVAFLLFITAPTILLIVDDTVDTSVVFSFSEEEEQSMENDISIEMLLVPIEIADCCFFLKSTEDNLEFFYKKYQKPHLNKIYSPPELYI